MDEEIINLATYEFDTTKLEESLERLQKALFATKTQQQQYAAQSAELAKQQKELIAAQTQLIATGQKESAAFQDNKVKLDQLKTAQLGVFQGQKDLTIQSTSLNREYAQTAKAYAARISSEGQILTATERATAALEAETSTIEKARNANSQILTLRNQLSPLIEEEAALIKQLNSQYDANIAFIKENASAYENVKMNIGDYTKSIVAAYNEIEANKKALEELNTELIVQRDTLGQDSDEWKILNQQINNNITQINVYTSDLAAARGETEEAASATDLLSGGLSGFIERAKEAGGAAPLLQGTFAAIRTGLIGATEAAIAFIATPLGAALAVIAAVVALCVGAFKFVTASMNSTEEGSQKLAKVTATLSGFFSSFFKVLKPLGEFIGNAFVKYFDLAIAAIGKLTDAVSSSLRFIGLDDAADSLDSFVGTVADSANSAAALSKAEGELTVAMRNAKKVQLDYQKEAEKIRQLRDDETKSIPERIALNEKLGGVLKKQLNSELAIANKQLEVADLRIKSEGKTTEALDQRAEAITNISDIEERVTGQESEQLANLNSLRKEATDKQKADATAATAASKKNLDASIKNMETELALYVANSQGMKKSLESTLKVAKDVSDQELAIAKKQLDNKLISQKEYELKKAEIQNKYTATATQATIDNLDNELELFKLNNQRLVDENGFFSDELYQQEVDRLSRVNEAEKKALKDRFDANLLSQQEYQLESAKLEDAAKASRDAVKKEREDAEKASALANQEAENQLNQASLQYDLDEQLRQYDAGYAARLAAAKKAGISETTFLKTEAKNRELIEKTVQDAKIGLVTNAFGQIAGIFGEQSKIGKAAAIAQTTIDTYQSATAAYKGMVEAIPGPVGIAAGAVAAASSIALGFANVKKILAVKTPDSGSSQATPSYATGVIGIQGSGTGTSDDIRANLSAGESVITAQATSMFPNTLSALNMLGGGVGVDGNSVIQNSILQDSISANMVEALASAVYLASEAGTRAGSKRGLTDLSTNRQIAKNAKF